MRYPLSDSQQVATVSCGIELLSLKIDVVLCYVNYEQCCSLKVIFWFVRINSHTYTCTQWDDACVIENQVEIYATWVMTQMPPIELRQICWNKTSIKMLRNQLDMNIISLFKIIKYELEIFILPRSFASHTFRTIIYQLQSNI